MTELVIRNYWWPGVMRDVGRYVEGYDLFQRIKNRMEEIAGKLKLSKVPDMDLSNGRLYHEVTNSSQKGCDPGSLR